MGYSEPGKERRAGCAPATARRRSAHAVFFRRVIRRESASIAVRDHGKLLGNDWAARKSQRSQQPR